MTELAMRQEISGPGVYEMPDDVYHADPVPEALGRSLSSTGARKLAPPGTPAAFRHWQLHGQAHKEEFDFGHAAHRKILSAGAAIKVIDAPDWRTKEARARRDEAYAAGLVPLLPDQAGTVDKMAEALLEHPLAKALLAPERGRPEQSLFWRDEATGVWCRARVDLLPHPTGRRFILADYKTTKDASNDAVAKSAADYGYHQQATWYCAGVKALGLHPDPEFLFVFQEKAAPYLVNVVELDWEARLLGEAKNRIALDTYTRCLKTGRWPGYGDTADVVSLPAWLIKREEHLL